MLYLRRCTKPTIQPQNTLARRVFKTAFVFHGRKRKKEREETRKEERGKESEKRAICRLFLCEICGRIRETGDEHGPRSFGGSKLLRTSLPRATSRYSDGYPGTGNRNLLRDFVLQTGTSFLSLLIFPSPFSLSLFFPLAPSSSRTLTHIMTLTQRTSIDSTDAVTGSFIRSYVHSRVPPHSELRLISDSFDLHSENLSKNVAAVSLVLN